MIKEVGKKMWEIKNNEWILREESDGTLTLTSADGTRTVSMGWSEARSLAAIGGEADNEYKSRR
jgi:hypothetical protein